MIMLVVVILASVILGYSVNILYLIYRGPNYVSTPVSVLKHLRAFVRASDTFIDLGFGNGDVLMAIAPHAKQVIGYELDIVRFLRVFRHIRQHHLRNVSLKYKDVWFADLSQADVVYTFFLPSMIKRLYEKAKSEMKPGSVFICYKHAVPHIEPTKTQGELYLYRID